MKIACLIIAASIFAAFVWMRIEAVNLLQRSVELSSPAEVQSAFIVPFRQTVEFACATAPKLPQTWKPIEVGQLATQEGVSFPSAFADKAKWKQMKCFAQPLSDTGYGPYSEALVSSPDGKHYWLFRDQGW
ncbi:MAG: hypothetical protein K2W95_36065 [Candidatus Obscuribacterales bacterium]|nr:hypothetical protein [Candidatus Obscuribacterales bacterium]